MIFINVKKKFTYGLCLSVQVFYPFLLCKSGLNQAKKKRAFPNTTYQILIIKTLKQPGIIVEKTANFPIMLVCNPSTYMVLPAGVSSYLKHRVFKYGDTPAGRTIYVERLRTNIIGELAVSNFLHIHQARSPVIRTEYVEVQEIGKVS